MLIIKYDDELRNKIEGMKEVPSAFTFSPPATWQQLENKLQASPNKRKLVWWYWAAASLFIAFSTVLWLNYSKHTEVATLSNSSIIITTQTNKTLQNASIKQAHNHKNISLKTTKTSENNIAETTVKIDTIKVINKTTIAASNLVVAEIAIANMVDTFVQKNNINAQVVTTKPKRKVIHINELGEVITQPVVLTRNDYNQTHQQEENTTPIDANKPWWLFKPKPTTVNTFTNTSLTDNQ
ncbi:MAG: hypothetical protein QM541_11030 [Flavobacterium sp.]|nr:hypothetical protein [Flavobacterium sp.]